MLKLISWNVNGIRSVREKGFMDFFNMQKPDILCVQETKVSEGQINIDLNGYYQYWNYAQKKGYSGTAIFSKKKPISVDYDMGIEHHDLEGRIIKAEYDEFILVNVYTPNSKRALERLSYRMQWEDDFRNFLKELEKSKPVILCGDLNVAHKEIDLKNPSTNKKNAGFTKEEREKFTTLLEEGFTDTFRYFNPNKEGAYTWWSYMFKAREKNAGWRIDYFLTSKALEECLQSASIHSDVYGSDHCPVELMLKL